jgi:heme oxygenase (biliverdin-producing, ferredoxin)
VTVTPFSQLVRERSRAAHQAAESSPFITEMLGDAGTREQYTALMEQQYFIYQALEAVGEVMLRDPQVAAFAHPGLTRMPAIEADLAFLLGDDWFEQVRPLEATRAYVDRIYGISGWAGGFVAHHYTRYLGDLSGGQAIRTILQRRHGFETNGVGFYLFAEIAKPKDFRDTYRAQLDAVDWDDAERERVLEEVNRAFELNRAVFRGLESATAAAS